MDDSARRIFDDRHLFSYRELAAVPVAECGEPLVAMETEAAAGIRTTKLALPWIRSGALDRLRLAGRVLLRREPRLHLRVLETYRSLARQRKGYEHYLAEFGRTRPELDREALMEYVHLHVAVPDVAGHPTGGAIDLTLADESGALDMGSAYGDFSTPLYHAFAEGTTEAQRANRMLLRQVMVEAGFAPFTGEWWHFSYGDREWAAIWGRDAAIYEQLESPGTEAAPRIS